MFGFPLYCLSLLSDPSALQIPSICEAVGLWLDGSDYGWVWKDCTSLPFLPALLSDSRSGMHFRTPCTQSQCHCWSRGLALVWGRMAGQELGTNSRMTAPLNIWCDPCGGEMWMWDFATCVERSMFASEPSRWSIQQIKPVVAGSQLLLRFFIGTLGMFWGHSQEFTRSICIL